MLVVLICTVIFLVVLYVRHFNAYWRRRGIPEIPSPRFPFGHFWGMTAMKRSFGEVCYDLYHKIPAGSPLAGAFILLKPAAVLKDPELLKTILVKDFSSFHDRGLYINEDVDPLSGHLFLLSGNRWRALRNKLSPTFTSGKMKMMFQVVADCAAELAKVVQDTDGTIEVRELLARYSTDVIGSCAFGINCNCLRNPNNDFRQWMSRFIKPSKCQALLNGFCFAAPKVANALRIRTIPKDVHDYFMSLVGDTIAYRRENNVSRNDFMQLLMQLMDQGFIADAESIERTDGEQDTLSRLSLQETAAQAAIFFIAGFETSSATMGFALLEICLQPHIQRKLHKEVDDTLARHGGKVTYDCLMETPYLDKVISETLRKYPVVPVLNRKVNQDYHVPGTDFKLENGTPVIIPVLAIHLDSRIYPDPHRFDPERFSEENKARRHHYTYLPFGEGPRVCIGQRFGLMQTKLGLIALLSNYYLHPCEKTVRPANMKMDPLSFMMCPVGGIWLKASFREREL